MKKKLSRFEFSQDYVKHGENRLIRVNLNVEYGNKCYGLTFNWGEEPLLKEGRDALSECIHDAIHFAERELGGY